MSSINELLSDANNILSKHNIRLEVIKANRRYHLYVVDSKGTTVMGSFTRSELKGSLELLLTVLRVYENEGEVDP